MTVPATGRYRVFVRTMDWVARWQAPGEPGRFRLHIGGVPLPVEFGTEGADWHSACVNQPASFKDKNGNLQEFSRPMACMNLFA